ncbi:MAG: hypothetical protein GY813_09425 [Halieaceae bacterium]|nr:hypothetical protein [Halieaceae bacterium]
MQCQASGQLFHAKDIVRDVRQGKVGRKFADLTAGFGTWHPQDLRQLGDMDDPSPIHDGVPKDNNNYSKQDLGISDQEIKLSIQEGRPPRRGF